MLVLVLIRNIFGVRFGNLVIIVFNFVFKVVIFLVCCIIKGIIGGDFYLVFICFLLFVVWDIRL